MASSSPSPESYHDYPADSKQPAPFNEPLLPSYLEQDLRRQRRRRCFRKLFRLLIFSTFLYFGFRFIAPKFHSLTGRSCHGNHGASELQDWTTSVSHWGDEPESEQSFPIPSGISIVECADLEDEDAQADHPEHDWNTALSFFDLPLSSDNLFFISRGPAVGNITFIQADEESEDVSVMTRVNYQHSHILKRVKVCKVRAEDGENGLGIFVKKRHGHGHHGPRHPHGRPEPEQDGAPHSPHDHPHRERHHLHLNFDIVVALPKASDDEPLQIPLLESDMPLFRQAFDELEDSVEFGTVIARSTISGISAGSIEAEHVDLKSVAGSIEGNFSVSRSLILSTVSAPIKVSVDMTNEDDEEPVELTLHTAAGPIAANISLYSGSDDEVGGAFAVSAKSASGPILLKFPTAPIEHELDLEINSAASPVDVALHPAYEGTIELQAVFGSPSISVDETVEDPAGQERSRKVTIGKGPASVKGTVTWDEEGLERSSTKVHTTVGKINVSL